MLLTKEAISSDRAMVRVRDATKKYAGVHAVDGVSLEIQPGEIFALLGPNGAGKTSLVRMMVGITQPDSGEVSVLDGGQPMDPRELGYLPEDRGLYKDVPVLRTLTYFGLLHGLPRSEARARGEAWLERLGLAERAKDKLDTLSKGNQQKVQFAAAVLHQPKLAILDEPFSGLDPLNQELFLDLIRDLRANGTTVLLSAHQMNLVERLADRLLLLRKGRVVLQGDLDAIRRQNSAGERYILTTDRPLELPWTEFGATLEHQDEAELALVMTPGMAVGPLLAEVCRQATLVRVQSEPVSLHDIYVSAVRDQDPTVENEVAE